ncbi:MAG: hypothetical protein K6E86_07410 [Bacteroidales bacterium]|nr:hypothetical protein [Bacteroidales bacterium]
MANYKWNYCRIGGVTRIYLKSGEDIAHLGELDIKQWTVLSCPVKGLEIDEASLKYIDVNNDGSIRVEEVVEVANWLTRVLKDRDYILQGKDSLPLALLNQEDADGKALYDSAISILKEVGKADAQEISLADSASSLDAFRKSKLEAAMAAIDKSSAIEAPFGDNTDAVEAAYNALDAKVKDYFMRSKLAQFSEESTAALDVQTSRIEAISADNLTTKMEEIASYPIARVDGSKTLSMKAAINPAWVAQFEVIRAALDPKTKEIDEALWAEIGAKIKAYRDYQASITVNEADIVLDEEAAGVQRVDKLLHLTRDFFQLLKNYVTFQDFYDVDKKAIFQCGTLVIDQRTCDFCVRVADAAALKAQSPKSGMYLITCKVTSKICNETYDIMAAMTVGDVDDLFVGKNCIFYDRAGRDFDARVTAIVDNPISIPQAMWRPYKKMIKLIEDNIEKYAAEKDKAQSDKAAAAINEKTDKAKKNLDGAKPAEGEAKASSFDIAKYAGIFAAIGMAVGMIGSALVAVGSGIMGLKWWQFPLVILAIMLVISGPSMFLAWLKLRKRNMAPVLNANGWAINASAKINIPFGETLTQQAKFPVGLKLKDPYADRKMPWWKKVLLWIVCIIVCAVLILLINRHYGWIELPFVEDFIQMIKHPMGN